MRTMKTMIGCFATNSLCEKVKGDWHQLASSMYKLPVDPTPSEEMKAMEATLLEKMATTCRKCETAQLIKLVKTDLKLVRKLLSDANKALNEESAKSFEILSAIHKRLVAEKPEFEEMYAIGTALFECALNHDAKWLAHIELLDGLEENVIAAEYMVAEAKEMLETLKIQLDYYE